ncbi:unnamed protein product [Pararhodospirillum photometricum DSM 122]|uniref:Uncharacterized protein n=1 Tax=Pararhodospirillum photometricum DSM 122 TaxID=1150469 RepID=H6SKD7_PARPM|nr:unnamed protein product [Pararhodospirillum photometricum DSM 122]
MPLPAPPILGASLHVTGSGKVTQKRLPWPGVLSTEMAPPCRSTMRLATANPIPVPG